MGKLKTEVLFSYSYSLVIPSFMNNLVSSLPEILAVQRKKNFFWNQKTWVQVLTLPFAGLSCLNFLAALGLGEW